MARADAALVLLLIREASAQPGPWVMVEQAQRVEPPGLDFLLGPQPELSLRFWVGYYAEIRSRGLDWFRERMRVDVQRDGGSVPVRIPTLQDRSYNSSDETVSSAW